MKEADLPLSRRKISSTCPWRGWSSDPQGKDQLKMHLLAVPTHTVIASSNSAGLQDPVLQISGCRRCLGRMNCEPGKGKTVSFFASVRLLNWWETACPIPSQKWGDLCPLKNRP